MRYTSRHTLLSIKSGVSSESRIGRNDTSMKSDINLQKGRTTRHLNLGNGVLNEEFSFSAG